MFVLIMNVDDKRAEGAQLAHRRCLAINITARPTVAGENTAYQALLGSVEIVVFQPAAHRIVVGDIKTGAHLGLFGILPNAIGVSAVAKRQAEGVENERFTGAGLPRYGRHAGGKLNVEMLNQGELPNVY